MDPTCGNLGDGKACEWYEKEEGDYSGFCRMFVLCWHEDHSPCLAVLRLLECRRERDAAILERDEALDLASVRQSSVVSLRAERDKAEARVEELEETSRNQSDSLVATLSREKEFYDRAEAAEADRDKWLEILAGMRCECGVYPVPPCPPCRARKEQG